MLYIFSTTIAPNTINESVLQYDKNVLLNPLKDDVIPINDLDNLRISKPAIFVNNQFKDSLIERQQKLASESSRFVDIDVTAPEVNVLDVPQICKLIH